MLLTQDKDFLPKNWENKFRVLKQMGFDGFEIDGRVLLDNFDEIRLAMDNTDFNVKTICGGYTGWIGDFDKQKRFKCLSDISELLEKGSAIGIEGIVVPAAWGMFSKRLPPMIPPRTAEEDEKVLIESLNFLNFVAAKTNTKIYLEPLNRYEDHMINTIETAANLIIKGNFKNVKICYDFFHMNIEESHMDAPIIKYKNLIGHVHLSSSHRYQPGSGHMDYSKALHALSQIKYKGHFALECRVFGDNLNEAYFNSVVYVKKSLENAGISNV